MHLRPDLCAPAMHRIRNYVPITDTSVRIRFAFGECAKGTVRTRVYETADAVFVAAFHGPLLSLLSDQGCTESGHLRNLVVELTAPLGDRPIIDAVTGKSLPG